MIKILLNCSTLMKGGALQVAASVIEEDVLDEEINWHFAITQSLYQRFENFLNVPSLQGRLILMERSPARSKSARKLLKQRVRTHEIEAIFTLFGPAYVSFPVPHLCGIADGWVTHSNNTSYSLLGTLREKIRTYLLCQYKLWWYQKADQWCVEALVAKNGFLDKTKTNAESVFVISNTVNQSIEKYAKIKIDRTLSFDCAAVFCLGADYWHKNYQIIPKVLAHILDRIDKKIIFYLTLPQNSQIYLQLMIAAKKAGVEQNIVNLGPLLLSEVITAYQKYNILFFPSVLETFSITPLEALYMNMPMIVSNIDANKQVVGKYAHYVEPLDSEDIAAKFIHVISNYDKEVEKLQILKDENYFASIPNAAERYSIYKKILQSMVVQKQSETALI